MQEPPTQPSVLVGWDGSSHAEDALELGRLIALATGASLVTGEVSVDRLGVLRRRQHGASRQTATVPAASVSVAAGVPMRAESRTIVSSSAGHGLHDLAQETGADLIVLGSTHRGPLGRVFLGSVADDLIQGAPCAVAIAPDGYARRYANRLLTLVVVAFDASPEAHAAAETAARIASATNAALRVLAVLEPPPLAAVNPGSSYGVEEMLAEEERYLRSAVAGLVGSLPPDVRAEGEVVSGNAVQTLVDRTASGTDLLVVGSRGYGPIGRTFLGSVSSEIVRSAACPVMVVPRGAEKV